MKDEKEMWEKMKIKWTEMKHTHTRSRSLNGRSVVVNFSFERCAHISNFNTLLLLHLKHSLYLWVDWLFFSHLFQRDSSRWNENKADSLNTRLLFNSIISLAYVAHGWLSFWSLLVVLVVDADDGVYYTIEIDMKSTECDVSMIFLTCIYDFNGFWGFHFLKTGDYPFCTFRLFWNVSAWFSHLFVFIQTIVLIIVYSYVHNRHTHTKLEKRILVR